MEAPTADYGSLGWAIQHMRQGWKVRRAAWPADVVVFYDSVNGILTGYYDGPAVWAMDQSDLLASDWQVVDAPQPGVTHA
jgi:hypothetical protein